MFTRYIEISTKILENKNSLKVKDEYRSKLDLKKDILFQLGYNAIEVIRILKEDTLNMLDMPIREVYIKHCGYAFITSTFLDELSKYLRGKKVVEIMCGKGKISKGLQKRGIEIIATDNNSWSLATEGNNDIEELDAVEAVRKYSDVDYIIMSWSPYQETIDYDVLQAVRDTNSKGNNQRLIVIGEYSGGCTGSDEYHSVVDEIEDKNFIRVSNSYERFKGIYDWVSVNK